jgi:N-acetylmuramoyl-L-alanine amidase
MPSVLCELGFISNASDQAKLMDSTYLDKAAAAIVDGIVKFLK